MMLPHNFWVGNLNAGESEFIYTDDAFVEMIRRRLGDDCAEYVFELVEAKADAYKFKEQLDNIGDYYDESTYSSGYDDGYDEGKTDGWDDGYGVGYNAGYDDAKQMYDR